MRPRNKLFILSTDEMEVGPAMDALQERLLRLEALVYGAEGRPTERHSSVLPRETVLANSSDIQQGLHRLEHSTPHLHDFHQKCNVIEISSFICN